MNEHQNMYQPSCPKKDTAFNSISSFPDTCSEITPEQKSHAFDLIDDLIAHTKSTLAEKE